MVPGISPFKSLSPQAEESFRRCLSQEIVQYGLGSEYY